MYNPQGKCLSEDRDDSGRALAASQLAVSAEPPHSPGRRQGTSVITCCCPQNHTRVFGGNPERRTLGLGPALWHLVSGERKSAFSH